MKKIFTTTLLALALCSANVMAKDYSLALSSPGKSASLTVEMMKGSITVQGYDGKTVEISANAPTLSPVKDMDDDDYHVEVDVDLDGDSDKKDKKRSMVGLKKITNNASQLDVRENNNRVTISSHTRKISTDLVIKVPFETRLKLELYRGGDIKVSDVSGAMELSNNKGAIYAEDVKGPIIAETHKNDIEVNFASLNQTSPSSLTTHKGTIDISLASTVKASVEVQTYKGEIFSGLDAEFVANDKVEHKRNHSGQEITMGGLMTAKVNGGGQTLTINTYKGNIYVRKK